MRGPMACPPLAKVKNGGHGARAPLPTLRITVMAKKPRTVVVNDRMQRGYVYALTAAVGRSFEKDFHPELTPKQMLALGVFGGKYMTDCRDEFPASWFARARLSPE